VSSGLEGSRSRSRVSVSKGPGLGLGGQVSGLGLVGSGLVNITGSGPCEAHYPRH